jgi:hypothetical protein
LRPIAHIELNNIYQGAHIHAQNNVFQVVVAHLRSKLWAAARSEHKRASNVQDLETLVKFDWMRVMRVRLRKYVAFFETRSKSITMP